MNRMQKQYFEIKTGLGRRPSRAEMYLKLGKKFHSGGDGRVDSGGNGVCWDGGGLCCLKFPKLCYN